MDPDPAYPLGRWTLIPRRPAPLPPRCRGCAGTGEVNDVTCRDCGGSGEREEAPGGR